jgi:hypothetical protein
MTWAYIVHAMGGMLTQLPYLEGPGVATVLAARGIEAKVDAEWLLLQAMEAVCRALVPLKQFVQNRYVPGVYRYTQQMVQRAPAEAEQAALGVGNLYGVDATLFPGLARNPSDPPLRLPVTPEPAQLDQPARSQLVRAATPWVQLWRVPVFQFADDCLGLARFKQYYQRRTNEYTLAFARQFKDQGINLYVLPDLRLDAQDKGNEFWRTAPGSRRADELFAVVGFAHRPPLPVMNYPVFRQTNPDGLVAYAQALVYNANTPDLQRRAGWQPMVGWDTLNWGAGQVPEYPGPQAPDTPHAVPAVPQPCIRLNWQVKLIPATRLKDSVPYQQGGLGAVLRRLPPQNQPLDSTH